MRQMDFKSFLIGFLFAILICLILWYCMYRDIGRYQISAGYGTIFTIDTKTGEIRGSLSYESFQDIPLKE